MDNSKSYITSKSIAIAARIPLRLHSLIEDYGRLHFPNGDSYEKTATIIDLIRKGLGCNDLDQSSQNSYVKQNVKQDVKQIVIQEAEAIEKRLMERLELRNSISEDNEQILGKLNALSSRISDLERENEVIKAQLNDETGKTENFIDVESETVKKTEGMTAASLSSIFDALLPDEEIFPDNEDKSNSSNEKPKSSQKGLNDYQLADLLTKQGKKVGHSTVNRWRNGKAIPDKNGKNKNLFKHWEVKGNLWFKID